MIDITVSGVENDFFKTRFELIERLLAAMLTGLIGANENVLFFIDKLHNLY